MELGVWSAIAYGILAAVGGIIGYAQARSQVSLISGLISGGLLFLGAWLWSIGSAAGSGLAMGVTVALVIVFLRRWQQTRKAMPALLMVVTGLLALIGMVISLG
ncbi:TMEM14 family protein [Nodosilinea sp. P-1105]|uniref:TMEM14 family protein n=1 Tax=Nodosilinea sp. P-1105 TaxID=2546229 RepID=UPI00146B9CE0|nr:TMEM14 family protein [Nodosilinea sp. P-1105]NMF82925.1 hypothetical protein [Nodosilinea sp. P-1105]